MEWRRRWVAESIGFNHWEIAHKTGLGKDIQNRMDAKRVMGKIAYALYDSAQ
jgi:hypothetical protein